MPKEYRTIQEVAGPLMMVRGVDHVTYDELGEIELKAVKNAAARSWRLMGIPHFYSCLRVLQVSTFLTVRCFSWTRDGAWCI